MFLTIFFRELISSRLLQKKGYKFYLNLFFNLISIIILVCLLCYVYNLLYEKLAVFTNFNKSFLVVVLTILTFLLSLYLVKDINNVYFSRPNEIILLKSRPIDNYSIIFGKLAYVYLKSLIYNLLTIFVILVLYGDKLGYGITYHCYNTVSLIFLAFLELGLALLFSIIVRFIRNILNKSKLLSFLTTIILAFVLAIFYALVLKGFVNLVRGDSLNNLFNSSNVNTFTKISTYLYPLYSVVALGTSLERSINFLVILVTCGTIFLLACLVFKFYYVSYLNGTNRTSKRYLDHEVKLTSTNKALIKKELFLSFNQADGVFSYFSLIVIEPLLIYAVISGLNLIFQTGNLVYFKQLYASGYLSMITALIILFVAVINATSSIALEKERRMLIKLKVLPISPVRQMTIKIIVPFVISSTFYLISLIVLIITKEIDGLSFGYLLVIGLISLLVLNISSIYTDLKTKTGLLSLFLDFVLPIIYILVAFVISILININENLYYLIILGLEFLTLLVLLTIYKKVINKGFISHEVVD